MMRKSSLDPSPDQPLSRKLLLTLVKSALSTGELHYARQLCSAWLAIFPGDLDVSLHYARAFFMDKSPALQAHARPILEMLCQVDPEFLEAQQLLAEILQRAGSPDHVVAKAYANALSHGHAAKTAKNAQISSWSKCIFEARNALSDARSGNYQQIDKAEYYIHKALVQNPDNPLAAVVHLRTLGSKGSMPKIAVRNLAQIYHERWPVCLQFLLTLSNELMEAGESNRAVEMLHQATCQDITGRVAKRMWGEHHPYASIWPDRIEASASDPNSPQRITIPAGVAALLGRNQLSVLSSDPGSAASYKNTTSAPEMGFSALESAASTTDDAFQSIAGETEAVSSSKATMAAQTELERMADELKRPHIAHEDGRFPVYVVFTTRAGLANLYDPASVQAVDAQLKKLIGVIQGTKINNELWGSLLFYADDISSTQPYGLQPAAFNDASRLKTIVSNLDGALQKRGERIGSLLIVGGPEVVPFHNLPNPVEDADDVVASDNPYSAKDNNYFISDWPVGRISGGSGTNATGLLTILRELTNRYDNHANRPSWYLLLLEFIREFIKTGVSKKVSSFGYTAAVWRRASLSVFRSIGNPDDMLISPPIHACDSLTPISADAVVPGTNGKGNTCLLLPDTRLAYFNLHGVPDSSEWYGQSDPTLPEDGPEFPVAMRPQDIHNSGSAPRMVFTEACYGANITGKQVDDAIALKLLASGTQAVVGSTCISYGSLSTPLSSADLLGRVFWNLLQEGFTAGESLRRAKIELTREMNNRQGFLDAEDQKTLISFVLFGDPLAQPFQVKVSPKITPHLSDAAIPVRTVCERSCEGEAGSTVPLETIAHLKSIVAQYLPDMGDAQVNLYHEHPTCANLCGHCGTGKPCGLSHSGMKNGLPPKPRRRVVTLSKNYERAQHIHRQYARLTLDERGKIVKMVVSH